MKVSQNGWGKLVKHLESVVTSNVLEFYVNVKEYQGYKSFVRGKMVPFDAKAVNTFYELDNVR